MVIAEQPDGRAMTVRAQLYAWDGTELADRSFPVYMGKRVKEAGLLRARLPWSGAKGLVLRMQVMQEGRLVAVNHACYACLDENGERVPFPKADLNESESDGIRELWNASDAIAVGVCVSSGEKVLLHNSAMLPGERIALAHDAQIMVQYGNAIKKGGKAIAAQRVLRRVQRDPDASSAHPQIEQ